MDDNDVPESGEESPQQPHGSGAGANLLKRGAKSGAKNLGNKGLKMAAEKGALTGATGGYAAAIMAAEELQKKLKLDKLKIRKRDQITLLIVLIVAFIMLIFLIFTAGTGGALQQDTTTNLTITKTGPDNVPNPNGSPTSDMLYSITATYPGQATDVTITDPIPTNATFVSASGKYTTQTTGQTINSVTWSGAANGTDLIGGQISFTVTLVLRPMQPNSTVVNIAQGEIIGGTTLAGTPPAGGPPANGYVAPSADSCGGKYNLTKNFLLPKNFGDPSCNFTKDALYTLIEQQDPQYAALWYTVIVPGESGYNPNAWAPPTGIQLSLDASGAWGLYQMGSSKPPGSPPPAPGKNGPLDRGDVNWETQTANAIGYNKQILHCSFRYWATARSKWGAFRC